MRIWHVERGSRRNRWSSYSRLSEGLIVAKTAVERATLYLLSMNQAQTFALRRVLDPVDQRYAGLVVRRCR